MMSPRAIHPVLLTLLYLTAAIVHPLALLSIQTPDSPNLKTLAQTTESIGQIAQQTMDSVIENERVIREAMASGDKAALDRARQKIRVNTEALEKLKNELEERQSKPKHTHSAQDQNSRAWSTRLAIILVGLPWLFFAYKSGFEYLRSIRVHSKEKLQ